MREWAQGETLHGLVDRVSFGKRGLLRTYVGSDREAWLTATHDIDSVDPERVPVLNQDSYALKLNAKARFDGLRPPPGMGRLGIFVDGELVGELGWMLVHPRAVKVEYWLRKSARGSRTMRAVLTAFIDAVRRSGLDPDCWIASIHPENKASEKIVGALGFVPSPASDLSLPREWYLWEPGRSAAH
jgi:RimJ/RimL family protein N-acetyltransferase